jgi:hypothetical protein
MHKIYSQGLRLLGDSGYLLLNPDFIRFQRLYVPELRQKR